MNKKKFFYFIGVGIAINRVYENIKNRKDKLNVKGQHIPYGPYEAFIKRPLDILIAGTALVGLGPLMLAIGILVKVKLGSPIIFSQDRPGLNRKIFKIYKFRTMEDKYDDNGQLLPDRDRITIFGKCLRKTSLDELPELFNILKGDMSIIGPRPLLVKYLPYYTQFENKRHDVRPGLTGYSQVHGRNNVIWEERFQMDIEYAEHITFFKDLKVFTDTIRAVVLKKDIILSGLEDFDVYRQRQWDETKYRHI